MIYVRQNIRCLSRTEESVLPDTNTRRDACVGTGLGHFGSFRFQSMQFETNIEYTRRDVGVQ